MPVYQKLVDFNTMFAQLKDPPIIINDMVNSTEEDKLRIKEILTTRYTSDMLSVVPTCRCGETKGEFSIGVVCQQCGTPVKSIINEDIEPIVWFRVPEGVRKLISPVIWTMLDNRFKKSGFSVMQWICDPTYRTIVKQPPIIAHLQSLGIQRGYNNFVDNFDSIIATLMTVKDFRLKAKQRNYLEELLAIERHKIFPDYLAVPNKSILLIEKTNVGIYVDASVIGVLDALEMIVSIDSPSSDFTPKAKENRTIKAIVKLAEFYKSYLKTNVAGKPGILRKHTFGSRTHFSFRAVITSITKAHNYDEIYVPWGVGLTAFRPHIVNKLLKRGYELIQIISLIMASVENYHPLLDEILKELIAESHDPRGIAVLEQRN